MRALQALVMLLGALAVLMIGAIPASATVGAPSTPPCHETASHHAGAEAPAPTGPGKAVKAMDCCVACVGAPALTPPARARLTAPPPSVAMTPGSLPTGERPAPEPHPPRRVLD